MVKWCQNISSLRMALHNLWESGNSWCLTALFFRADSSCLEAGSLNAVCSNLPEYKKLQKKKGKKGKKTNPCCPCLACSSSIISTVAEVPRLKGPAWLAVLQTVHRAGQSYPQARSGRLSPRGFQSQPYRPCMWGRPLCSRCHCLSHCLHRLQYRNTSQNEHSTAIAV